MKYVICSRDEGTNRLVYYLGFNVIGIDDITFKVIDENKELYEKFHDPNYAIR